MVRFGFELSIFSSLRMGLLRIGFELGQVISGVGYFSSCYNLGFVQLWISLLWVFGSKSVHPISSVDSAKNPGRSIGVSGLGLVLQFLLSIEIAATAHSTLLSSTK